jgi:hypothetical protein
MKVVRLSVPSRGGVVPRPGPALTSAPVVNVGKEGIQGNNVRAVRVTAQRPRVCSIQPIPPKVKRESIIQ